MTKGASLPPLLLLLAIVSFVGITAWPRFLYIGDPMAAREEGRSLVLHGSLSIDADMASRMGERGQYFVLNPRDGKFYSKFGIMNALLAVPPLAAEFLVSGALPPVYTPLRLLALNFFQLVLGVALAAVLYRLAGDYAAEALPRILFVLSAFYATFLWNYLRAQASECAQALFFSAFFLYFCRAARAEAAPGPGASRGELVKAWSFLLVLVLTRTSYLVLCPVAVGLLAWAARRQRGRRAGRGVRFSLGAAASIGACVALVQAFKFGSPWSSGYQQWHPEVTRPSSSLPEAVVGFLLDPQRSVPLHFPVLVLAPLGLPSCWRRRRLELICAWALFAPYFLFIGMLPTWRGEWGYGPRYLLFALPVLALPCASFIERALSTRRRWRRAALGAAALLCAASSYLQVEVNGLEFFAYYRLKAFIDRDGGETLRRSFGAQNFGFVNRALLHSGDVESLWFLREYRRVAPRPQADALRALIEVLKSRPNYYWSRAAPRD